MNILFVSIAWPKPGERNLYSDLMEEFVSEGHNVFVLGASESYANLDLGLKVEEGIHVLRIRSGKIRKTSHLRKTISLLSLGQEMLKALRIHFNNINIDLLICPTPPITLSRFYKKLKKTLRAPFYLLLKDIWPQGSVDLGVIHKYSLPWIWLRFHEISTYKTADYIGCMSPKGVEYILSRNRYIPKDKVEVCPNCIRPEDNAINIHRDEVRIKYGIPADACVFIFSGNLGIGHGLGFLIDAIRELKDYSKAFFVIGGSGTHFQFVANQIKGFGLKNVFVYEWLPASDYNSILTVSDVGLILLYKYTVPQFPSRLLSYMNSSKAVLCAINERTDIGTIVVDSGSGRSVLHGDLAGFVREIKYLSENIAAREEMGKNSRKLFLDNFTVKHGYKIIIKHFVKYS